MEQLQPFIHPKNNLLSTSYISGTALGAGNIKISWTWSLPSTCKWKMIWHEVYVTDTRTDESDRFRHIAVRHSEERNECRLAERVGRGYSRRENGMYNGRGGNKHVSY